MLFYTLSAHVFTLNLARIAIFHIFAFHRKYTSHAIVSLESMNLRMSSLSHGTLHSIIFTHLPIDLSEFSEM